jgi:uncharacterized protein (TIRG00374 family)
MYRKISAIVIPTLIAAGIIGYMLYSIRDDLLLAFQHVIPLYLIVAVAICLCAWWLRGWRYHSILTGLNYHVGVIVSTACIFVSQTVNLIVPARLGDFVRVFILKHEFNTTYSEGVSSLVVERVFDIFTVALLGALSLFFLLKLPAMVHDPDYRASRGLYAFFCIPPRYRQILLWEQVRCHHPEHAL